MADMSIQIGTRLLEDHTITCPLTEDPADGRTIDVFARVITPRSGGDLPFLVFLQGGPGNESPALFPSWMTTALARHRVVLLDQRGTGRSTPVAPESATAEYLTHLRADAIVRDCEAMREHLGAKTWSVLGQSFGGFTLLHYLTVHPESVDNAYFTGGLAPVGHRAEDIYATTFAELRRKSLAYYTRFPHHRDAVAKLVELAADGELVLPDGEVVSVSRVRSLGMLLGSNDGWLSLFNLLEQDPRTTAFRHDLAALLPFGARNPLYYVLHESSMADGVVTDWAAERAMPTDFAEDPTLLTGEHVSREWLETVPGLRPWAPVARELAGQPWNHLYDPVALEESGARGAAAVYVNDAYVPLEYSRETAGFVPGVRTWVTSEHEHNGLRASDGAVLARLFELADGTRLR